MDFHLKLKLIILACVVSSNAQSLTAAIPSSRRSRAAIAKVKSKLQEELQAKGLRYGAPIFIRIFKQTKKLEIWIKKNNKYALFRTYPIFTFSGDLGPKLQEGDCQAPEGFYFVKPSQMNPNSRFHLSFNLGYPNAYDRMHNRTGSALMVHGNKVSIGCFAMTDPLIEEIYALADAALRGGQSFFRVHIFPFKMTDAALKEHASSKWISFWRNVKEGYDAFEASHVPPNIEVANSLYVVEVRGAARSKPTQVNDYGAEIPIPTASVKVSGTDKVYLAASVGLLAAIGFFLYVWYYRDRR